jgi:hypothetical protein
MSETKVVNLHKEPYDVYIGRGSPYGNPYSIGIHGTREEVLIKFEKYFKIKKKLIEKAKRELTGKTLGCFCKPQACHGDIIKRYIEENNE